ncbi:MAG: hypothetical protein ACYTGR_16020 [Planctomycetota bacterium]
MASPPTAPVTRIDPRPGDQRPASSPTRVFMVTLSGLGVMLPWPLLLLVLLQSHLDQPDEVMLLFGGVTGLLILAVGAVTTMVSEAVFCLAIGVIWALALLLPPICLARRLRSRGVVLWILGGQAVFSIAQALLGAMMIVGKAA